MSVSMPIPVTRIKTRTIRFVPALGAFVSCSRRAFSIWFICLATRRLHSMSRRNSLSVVGGMGSPSGVRRFQALRRLLELGVEVANAKRPQGRLDAVDDRGVLANEGLAFAVGALGIFLRSGRDGAILQCWRSPRSQPRKARMSCWMSSRSVLARRCSRDTRGSRPVSEIILNCRGNCVAGGFGSGA